jgi:hypothetical protein
MNFTGSWKTTSTGITMIVAAIVGFYFAFKNNQISEATITVGISSLLGGIGLIFSKDKNVTGGTTINPANDPSVVKDSASK